MPRRQPSGLHVPLPSRIQRKKLRDPWVLKITRVNGWGANHYCTFCLHSGYDCQNPFNHSSILPSVHSSIHSSIYPSIPPSLRPSIRPFIYRPIRPSLHPSIHPSIHSSTPPSVHPSIYPSIHLSLHPPIPHLSIPSSIHPFLLLDAWPTTEVVRIGSISIFHLSKLWKATFVTLCDVIFLVRLQKKKRRSLLGAKGLIHLSLSAS